MKERKRERKEWDKEETNKQKIEWIKNNSNSNKQMNKQRKIEKERALLYCQKCSNKHFNKNFLLRAFFKLN
jgi:hypothetical protein